MWHVRRAALGERAMNYRYMYSSSVGLKHQNNLDVS